MFDKEDDKVLKGIWQMYLMTSTFIPKRWVLGSVCQSFQICKKSFATGSNTTTKTIAISKTDYLADGQINLRVDDSSKKNEQSIVVVTCCLNKDRQPQNHCVKK